MRLDKLEREAHMNDQITIILRSRPYPGTEKVDPYKHIEKFKRVEGWPLGYTVFAEKLPGNQND